MSLSNPSAYRDPKRVTWALELVLLVGTLVALWSLGTSCLQIALLRSGELPLETLRADEARVLLVGTFAIVAYLAVSVVLGFWVHRAYKNLSGLGATGLDLTPGWAVAFFYIPIVCLWKPREVMADLWRASRDPERWRASSGEGPVFGWWMLWLGGSLLGTWIIWLQVTAGDLDDLLRVSYLNAALDVVTALLFLTTMRLAGRIADAQERTADRRQRSSGSEARREVPAALRYDPPARGGSVHVR